MLLIACIHIILFIFFLWAGYLVCAAWLGQETAARKHPVILVVHGLIFYTLIAQFVALFLPVHFLLFLLISTGVVLRGIIHKNSRTGFRAFLKTQKKLIPGWAWIPLGAVWVLILQMAAGPLLMDDTESYHIQAIKWIREYGSVPGIVNLHFRYGFNSSWFSAVALTGISQGPLHLYTALNSFLSLLLVIYLLTRLLNTPALRPGFLLVLLAVSGLFPLIRGNAATANYDFITSFLVFLLFAERLFATQDSLTPDMEWLLWPMFLFTVRFINFPVLLLSLFPLYALLKNRSYRRLAGSLGWLCLLTLPFIGRNILVSGYPFFPSAFLDIASVDWKAPLQLTEDINYFVRYYNRVNTTFLDLEQTRSLGETGWIPYWFRYLYLYDKLLVVTAIPGFLLLLINVARKRLPKKIRVLTLVFLFQLMLWFLVAPDPRFVYGILLSGLCYLPYAVLKKVPEIPVHLVKLVLAVWALGVAILVIRKTSNDTEYRNPLIPRKLETPRLDSVQLEGKTYYIPERVNNNWNPRCYGSPLPCLYDIQPGLEARGPELKDGFRIKK